MTETLSSVVAAASHGGAHVFEVRSPASGELLAHVRGAGRETVDAAVSAAREAFAITRWAGLAERVGWCAAAAAAIEARAEGLAAELAEEQGKPLHEAAGVIAAGARGFRLAAEAARGLDGFSPPSRTLPSGWWSSVSPGACGRS